MKKVKDILTKVSSRIRHPRLRPQDDRCVIARRNFSSDVAIHFTPHPVFRFSAKAQNRKQTSPSRGEVKKVAFTLAEVLITLGIIGVVAAMILPTLILNHRNKALNVGLKKAYSTISQALTLYENDNGIKLAPPVESLTLKPILMKYIKAKDCGYGTTDWEKACVPNMNYVTDPDKKNVYRNFNNKNKVRYTYFDDGQFIINDTMFVMLENATMANGGGILMITVDVNGFNNKPNRLGQDLFMFQIVNDGRLLPMGAEGTVFYSENDDYCSLTSSDSYNGAGCTVKALADEKFFEKMPK